MRKNDRTNDRDGKQAARLLPERRHRKAGEPRMPKDATKSVLSQQQRPGSGNSGPSETEEQDR